MTYEFEWPTLLIILLAIMLIIGVGFVIVLCMNREEELDIEYMQANDEMMKNKMEEEEKMMEDEAMAPMMEPKKEE